MRILLLSLLLILNAHAEALNITPTKRINEKIEFHDDLEFKNLDLAISRQLKSYSEAYLKGTIKFGADTFKKQKLKDSLLHFKSLFENYFSCKEVNETSLCLKNFNDSMNEDFYFYRPIPRKEEQGYKTGETLFTGYYSPDLDGSRIQTEFYKNPIYAMPKEEGLRTLSRVEIDFDKKLEGKGYELFYVSDSLYDLWLFHVEGGGRVHVTEEDGSRSFYYLSYAGTNGQKFQMLYRYMLDHGMLTDDSSISAQRKYLNENPEKQREVFSSSPSYIYFKVTKDEPLGVNNIPLTEGRSMATDYRTYKDYGLIQFVQTKKPTQVDGKIVDKKFSRFFISQDTGGAIKGNARADLYFGYGEEAELSASYLKHLGTQTILIKK